MTKQSVELPFKCEHCNKKFARASTFQVHVCEKKRRYFAKDEKHSRFALTAFQRFFEFAQPTSKLKTFDEFANSPYYTAFIKFGSYLSNAKPIQPTKYIDFVIKSETKLDNWCDDKLYEKYIYGLIRVEPVEVAIERSLNTMVDWSETTANQWELYFSLVNLNVVTHHIMDGRISPWVILNSSAGKAMLGRLSDEQLGMVAQFIAPEFWQYKFKHAPSDVILCKEVIKEAKLR